MSLEQKIKEEIYSYILKFDLEESEIKQLDTYVLQLLENFSGIIKTHDNIITDKEKINMLKTAILENIGS
tara:strand:- start:55 stop:264 length:210 start_codon:yes stop_codon:yes gene_type:complete